MPRNKQQNQQQSTQAQQAQAQEQAQAKTRGALTPAAAVRLWNGDLVSRSMLVAEGEGELAILATEMQLTRKTRSVAVATKKRAEVRGGRIHPLDSPVTVGTARFGFDEALTQAEAATRASKWLKKAASLDALARQGDEDAKERAKSLRERAKVLARAYNLVISKQGEVTVKSETETAETEPAK